MYTKMSEIGIKNQDLRQTQVTKTNIVSNRKANQEFQHPQEHTTKGLSIFARGWNPWYTQVFTKIKQNIIWGFFSSKAKIIHCN